jgi:hypothetical protein
VTFTAPSEAVVHVAADYPETWLELRSAIDGGPWKRTCKAPCDIKLVVDGTEARLTAPGMITSNTFRIEPGSGTARLKISGGSATARTVGLTLLIAGLPVTFGGMAGVGIGATQGHDALKTAGFVGLAVGGLAVLAAIPLLLRGSTNVRNEKGDYIAGRTVPLF